MDQAIQIDYEVRSTPEGTLYVFKPNLVLKRLVNNDVYSYVDGKIAIRSEVAEVFKESLENLRHTPCCFHDATSECLSQQLHEARNLYTQLMLDKFSLEAELRLERSLRKHYQKQRKHSRRRKG